MKIDVEFAYLRQKLVDLRFDFSRWRRGKRSGGERANKEGSPKHVHGLTV
jgi:hypothetical protein